MAKLQIKVICYGVSYLGKRIQKTLNLDIPDEYIELHPQKSEKDIKWSYFSSMSNFQWVPILGWTMTQFKYAQLQMPD